MPKLSRAQKLLGASGLFILGGFCAELVSDARFSMLLYVAAAVAGLVFLAPAAVASVIKRHTADMNVLMSVAVLGALIMGFVQSRHGMIELDTFRDAAIVIFLAQIGEWLEDWSKEKTTASLKELENLAPSVAYVERDGALVEVPISEVAKGTMIVVKPGGRVPLDGVVASGTSDVNEASITGEFDLATKAPGDMVYAGSLNTESVLTISVSAASGHTVLDGIISQVESAEKNRAPYEAFVARFAKVYTPLVLVCAFVVGVCVPSVLALFGGDVLWSSWIWRALTLLVIACPCALVISTPVAFVSAISRAAKAGILVKGGAAFDLGTHVQVVAFDKTGTITEGTPCVREVLCEAGVSEAHLLNVAAALELTSTHPLAKAVCERAGSSDLRASQVQEEPGHGVCGEVDGKPAYVQKPQEVFDERARELRREGATLLEVSFDGRVLGYIACEDQVRANAKQAIGELTSRGLKTVLLSGDTQESCEKLGAELGISEVKGGLLPAQKVACISAFQSAGESVCMVGDGVNDGPALATADVSVALGKGASDTTFSLSHVVLLGSDLMQLVRYFALSRRTMCIARENIAFALVVKFGVLVLSALGLAGMGAAIFADTGVMLLVVLNGLRLML